MLNIRTATPADVEFIYSMIKQLAEFEKAPEQVTLTLEQLEKDGFGNEPLYRCLIAEQEQSPIGFALFYFRYSTWKGKSLYLEDLYIVPESRKRGYGTLMFKKLGQIAVAEDCRRFEWQVLDWNTPAIEFYKKFGAKLDSEWINCKFEEVDLENFAKGP